MGRETWWSGLGKRWRDKKIVGKEKWEISDGE
jgi:hypothetical protein